MTQREITRDDILDMDDYVKVRPERKRAIAELKKNRRVAIGPDATFYFESYDTMLDRKSVAEGKSVELGGRRNIKKKNNR